MTLRAKHRSATPSRLLVVSLVIGLGAFVLPVAVAPVIALSVSSPLGVTIPGFWDVRTPTAYNGVTIVVGGGIRIDPGGSLSLTDAVLILAEPSDLANGIEVSAGGALSTAGTTITSGTTGLHWWLRAEPGAQLNVHGGRFTSLGGTARPGIDLLDAGAQIVGTQFDQYVQAVRAEGPSETVSRCFFGNTTGPPSSYIVQAEGNGSGFQLLGSTIQTTSDVGALAVSAPSAVIEGNSFWLDPSGSNTIPIRIGYSGPGQDANGSAFLGNSVDGADLTIDSASGVTVSGNVINDPGPGRLFAIHALVTLGTIPGLWIRGLTIDHNVVANYSDYGIRIEQNVSGFHVDGNTILPPRAAPIRFGYQPDAIYLLRSVNNGTVDNNYIDMSAGPTVPDIGLSLESNVSDVTLRGNVVLNATQNALNIQGNDGHFDGAPNWETGPSDRNLVEDNEFVNLGEDRQTVYDAIAIVLWQWANDTSVVGNTIAGWGDVVPAFSLDGTAVLSSSSFGTFSGNLVLNASYGFVFRNFGSVSATAPGTFNRSDNRVFGNALYGISKTAVVEDVLNGVDDGMGPVANVIDALSSPSTDGGPFAAYLESVRPATALASWESNGTVGIALQAADPLTGTNATFLTDLPEESSPYSLRLVGPSLGSGVLAFSLPRATATSLTYTAPSSGNLMQTFCLGAPSGEYSVSYAVPGSGSTTLVLPAPSGAATFNSTSPGPVSVAASLVTGIAAPNATAAACTATPGPVPAPIAPGPPRLPPTPTSPFAPVEVAGSVRLVDGATVPGVPLLVEYRSPNGSTDWAASISGSKGEFTVPGGLSGGEVAAVRAGVPGYSVVRFNSTALASGVPMLEVVVSVVVPPKPPPAPLFGPLRPIVSITLGLGLVGAVVGILGYSRDRQPTARDRSRPSVSGRRRPRRGETISPPPRTPHRGPREPAPGRGQRGGGT